MLIDSTLVGGEIWWVEIVIRFGGSIWCASLVGRFGGQV